MGNQLTVNTLRNNLQDFKPDLQNYHLVHETCVNTKKSAEKYEFLREWKHKYEKRAIIEHKFEVSSQEQLEKALQVFIMRYHNSQLLSTQFIIINESLPYQLRVFSQKSITTLHHFKQIPSSDGAYFILQALRGFSQLVNKFGPFLVSQQMFQITQNRQVKIWLNQLGLCESFPNDLLLYSQQNQMLRKILGIVQESVDFMIYQKKQTEYHKNKYLTNNMIEAVKRANIQTIDAAIQVFQEMFQQEGIEVENKEIMCLKGFQYEELLNINSLNNKNNQYYQHNQHQNLIKINQRQQNIPKNRVSNNSMTNIILPSQTNLRQTLLQKQQPHLKNCIKRSQSLTSTRKGGISLTKTSNKINTTTQIPSHIPNSNKNPALNSQTSFYKTIHNNSTQSNRFININYEKSNKQILRLGQKRNNSKSYVSIEKSNCKIKIMNGGIMHENGNVNVNNDSRCTGLKKTSRVIISNTNQVNNANNTPIQRIPKWNIQNLLPNNQKKQAEFSLNNQYYQNHINTTHTNTTTPLSPVKINYIQPHQQHFLHNNNSTISYNYSITPKKINNHIDKYNNMLTYFDKQQLSRLKQQKGQKGQKEDIQKIYVYKVNKQEKKNENVRFVQNNMITIEEYNSNRQKYNNDNKILTLQSQNSMLQQQNEQTQRISTQHHVKQPSSYLNFIKSQLFTDPRLYNYITCDLDKKQLQKKRSSIEYSSFILSKQNILSKNKILQQSYTTMTENYLQSVPVSQSIDANVGEELNRLNKMKKNKNMEMLIEENSIKQLKSIDMISCQELVENNVNIYRGNNMGDNNNNNQKKIMMKNVSWKPFNIQHLDNGSEQKIPIKQQQYSQINSYNQLPESQPQTTIRRGYQQSVVMQYKKFNQNITDRSNNNNTDRRYFSPLKNLQNLQNQQQNKVDFKKSPVRYMNLNRSSNGKNFVGFNERQVNEHVKYVVYNNNEKLRLDNQKPSINPILMQDLQKIRRNKIF